MHCLQPINSNNVFWYISLTLLKHLPANRNYIPINPSSSDSADTLGIRIVGRQNQWKETSYFIEAAIRLKVDQSANDSCRAIRKLDFNRANGYAMGIGLPLALTEVILQYFYYIVLIKSNFQNLLNAQNGYLINNSLEFHLSVNISEAQ